MKAIPYILTLCFLFSCTKQVDVTPLLEQAERVMNVYPDSALTLLESIPNPERISDKNRAVWGLLLTQARDKNYMSQTSDSLITQVIHYFRMHDEPRRLALAYYYDGMIHYEREEFELSQSAWLQAEEAAAKVADFALLGRVYEHLGTLYREQGLTDLLLPIYRKELDSKQKIKDSVGIGITYNHIGRYYLAHDLDSAEYHLEQALSWLQGEPYQLPQVLNDLARVYRSKQDYRKAFQIIQQSLMFFESNVAFVNPNYLDFEGVYNRLQQGVLDAETKTTAYKELSEIYNQMEDYQQAYVYSNRYAILRDSVWRSEHESDMATQLDKYHKEVVLLERKHAESEFYGWVVGTVITVALLLVVWGLIFIIRRRKSELLRAAHQLTAKEKEIISLNQQLAQLHHSDDAVENLRRHYLKNSPLYCLLQPLIGKKREVKDFKLEAIHEEDWQVFYEQMDFVYAQFVSRLKKEFQLQGDYLKLACLILLNIQPCNSKNIYHITTSAVINKKNSLADKLGVPIGELDVFLKAFSKGNE